MEADAVIDALPDPFVVLSPVRDAAGDVVDFVFAAANARACAFNGVERDRLVGARLLDLHPAAESTGLLDAYRGVLATGEPLVLQDWSYPQDLLGGEQRRHDVYAAPLSGGIGQTWRDVTDRQDAAGRVERSEARLRAALESEIDGRLIADTVRDGAGRVVDFRVVMANAAAAAHVGRRPEELIGDCIGTLGEGLAGPQAVAAYRQVVETGVPFMADRLAVTDADGTPRHVDIRAVRAGGSVSVRWHDVTAMVEAERAVAAAREEYRLLAENAADLVLRIDAADETVWVSASVHRLLGYEPAAMLGRVRMDLVHPFDIATVSAAMSALRSGAALAVTEEVRLRHRNGAYTWWEATGRRTSDDPTGSDVVLALRDIDAQVRERDRAEEERTRRVAAVWSMLDPYLLVRAVHDRAGQVIDLIILDANEAAGTVLGLPAGRVTGSRLSALAPGLAGSALFALCVAAFATGDPVVADDVPYHSARRPQAVRVDVRAVPLGDDEMSVTWRDVTDRHEAAAALAASEARFRSAMESASIGMCLVGPDGAFLQVNPALCELLGREADVLTATSWQELTHADDLAVDQGLVDDILAGRREAYRLRKRYLRPDGSVLHGDLSVGCVRDGDGGVVYFVSQITDVSAQVDAEQSLRAQKELLQATLDAGLDPHVRLVPVRDDVGTIVDFRYAMANDAACRYNRLARDELVGSRLLDLLPGHAASGLLEQYARVLTSGQPLMLDGVDYSPELLGGQQRFFDIRVTPVGDGLSYLWRDVTERHRFEQAIEAEREQFRAAMDAAPIGKALVSVEGTILRVNPAMCAFLDRDEPALVGSTLATVTHPDDVDIGTDVLADLIDGTFDRIRFRARFQRPDGTTVHGDVAVSCIREPDGTIRSLITQIVDTTAEVAAVEALARLARTDTVTGLANRHEALNRLQHLLAAERRRGGLLAIAFCDLDEFKAVNDAHGHAMGDHVLHTVADRIRAAVRDTDTVARLGGDELVVILPGVSDVAEAHQVAEKIRHAVARPLTAPDGRVLDITVSIGVTLATAQDTVDALLSRADAGMYQAKRTGRNRTVLIEQASGRPG